MSKVTLYIRVQDGLSDWVGRAISWLTLGIIGVLIFEVMARYILNSPTIWGHELSTMFFGALGILAGSYTLRHQGHVRSDVIYRLLPRRAQALCDLVIFILAIVVLAVVLRMAVDFAYLSWEIGEFSNSSVWRPPLWPIKATIPLAVGLLMLQCLAELVRAALRLAGVTYQDPRDDPDGTAP
ncbi:C4-dicarboxylate ABC transporter substrate-binding protein [Halomonas sp. S2151]|uniref:TRAP transporter small permease subunit n=1 Tax=Halomonas sp. S2151 TaxID=579478 RepID=UPI0005FA3EFE|nr:TRAP transporter small permease subunit [Halomonas sp. S2151]KJZ14818.1 C4-dicarboxylate ABC transporter substrate-binding protein [Halomonas sp. S2151]